MTQRMRMKVVLRSGVSITVDVNDYNVERNKFSGELTGLSWSSPIDRDESETLSYLNLSNVDAIIAIRE